MLFVYFSIVIACLDLEIRLEEGRKLYFLSDLHLGSPDSVTSFKRERKLVKFLDQIKLDAHSIFFVGDVFDFWFEYKEVVPKNYILFFAKLMQLREQGINLYFLKGNHDLWLHNYIENLGIHLVEDKLLLSCNAKQFFITHGDGKGPGDIKYKLLKKIFTNSICKFLFRWLHPDIGIKIALTWSRNSYTNPEEEYFKGEDKEWLIQYAREKMKTKQYNYFIFGHRHLPIQITLQENSEYINLGEWFLRCTYGVFDGNQFLVQEYNE